MQQIECAWNLLTCRPLTVQSFSPATSIMYRNNKDWDFKGNPTTLVMNPLQGKTFAKGCNQRRRGYGMRTRAERSQPGEEALNHLKKLIIPKQKSEQIHVNLVQPILYYGSNEEKVDIDVLKRKNLFLLFSRLNIRAEIIHSLEPIHDKLQEHKKGVIVWIPVVNKWTDDERKNFVTLRMKMSWYTIKCFSPLKNMKHDWHFKGEPILTVMNKYGDVHHTDALPLIREKGIRAFPFLT